MMSTAPTLPALLILLLFGAVREPVPVLPPVDPDPAYTQVIQGRAQKIVDTLAIDDKANALQNGRDLCKELRVLGKDRICQIHCTDEDGVWLQDNQRLDMPKVKQTLDNMGWSGWLVIERSRDARDARDVVWNFGANTKYLKSIFQAGD